MAWMAANTRSDIASSTAMLCNSRRMMKTSMGDLFRPHLMRKRKLIGAAGVFQALAQGPGRILMMQRDQRIVAQRGGRGLLRKLLAPGFIDRGQRREHQLADRR